MLFPDSNVNFEEYSKLFPGEFETISNQTQSARSKLDKFHFNFLFINKLSTNKIIASLRQRSNNTQRSSCVDSVFRYVFKDSLS